MLRALQIPKYELLKDVLKNLKGLGYFRYARNGNIINTCEAKTNAIFFFW